MGIKKTPKNGQVLSVLMSISMNTSQRRLKRQEYRAIDVNSL